MNAHELKTYVCDLQRTFYQPMPERPVNPPEPKEEPSVEDAIRYLTESLKSGKACPYWDDFSGFFLKEMDCEKLDQMLIAYQGNQGLILLDRFKEVYERTIEKTASENYRLIAEDIAEGKS